jgi:putative transposase
MRYRRAYFEGGTYFFTLVTFDRVKIFDNPANIQCMQDAFECVIQKHPYEMDAHVFLPEHLHFAWKLPENDHDFSTRIRLLKSYFSRNCDVKYRFEPGESRKKKREKAIWQRRFWEHLIRDDDDYARHIEYIHYNPVKHGLVRAAIDWKYSSFHEYVKKGIYDKDWGTGEEMMFDDGIGHE